MLALRRHRYALPVNTYLEFGLILSFSPFWLSSPTNLACYIQEGVAIEIAEAVIGALKGELAATAVNAPMVPAEVSFNLHLYSLYSCLYQHVTSRHIKYN